MHFRIWDFLKFYDLKPADIKMFGIKGFQYNTKFGEKSHIFECFDKLLYEKATFFNTNFQRSRQYLLYCSATGS